MSKTGTGHTEIDLLIYSETCLLGATWITFVNSPKESFISSIVWENIGSMRVTSCNRLPGSNEMTVEPSKLKTIVTNYCFYLQFLLFTTHFQKGVCNLKTVTRRYGVFSFEFFFISLNLCCSHSILLLKESRKKGGKYFLSNRRTLGV